jgi:hypothetical protein
MKIYVKGNFLVVVDAENVYWVDNLENCVLSKTTDGATSFNIYMRSNNQRFVDVDFTDIVDETNTAYASQSVFEEYIYQNTGIRFQQPTIELDDLSDVDISAPSNGQVLVYNSTTSKWENETSSATGGDMTKAVYDVDNDGVVDSSEKLEFIAKNSTGVTIAKTKVVYISGATGQKPNITLADASLSISSSNTIGITRTSIANNADGYVITHGTIHDVNTSSFADGDDLWLSETAGDFTTTPPSEPAFAVFIGYVAHAHATQGRIVLHIQNGYNLNELHGVQTTSEANDDILQKKGGLWVNRTIAQLWEDLKATTITLTNKTLNLTSNTLSGTKAQFNTACSDDNFVFQSELSTSIVPSFKPNETFRGVQYRNNATTEDVFGGITISTTGTATSRAVATTNFATRQVRKGFTASVVSTGRYTGTRGSALLWYVTGGFRFVCDVYISDTAFASGCRQFYGMNALTADMTYNDVTQVDTMVNVIGFGSDSADTNINVFHNDGSGTCTKIDLGASFPANRSAGSALTAMYSFELYNDYSSNVLYKATNNETGVVVEGTISTNLPLSTQGLNFVASRCMGGGGGVTNTGQFDLGILGVYSL